MNFSPPTPARLSEEQRCLDRFLPGEASATEKKEACILCGNAPLPNALWLQLVPDHMTLDHIDERDSGFARVSCSLEVTTSSVSTPVRQWKKVIILPASPFLSVGKVQRYSAAVTYWVVEHKRNSNVVGNSETMKDKTFSPTCLEPCCCAAVWSD